MLWTMHGRYHLTSCSANLINRKTADELYMLIDTEGSFDKTDDFNNAVPTELSCYVCKTYIDEGQKYLPEGL